MTVREAVFTRRAMRSFDPTMSIDPSELRLMLHEAAMAPSALNLQNWQFIVCLDQESKDRLRAVSFDQQKLSDASAVVVVLGDLDLHRRIETHPDSNCFPPEEAEEWGRLAGLAYPEYPQRRREEAFRGCSLFAMTLMLLAQDRGWWTAPVGGFDEAELMKAFDVPNTFVPVLLVAIGKPGSKPPVSPRAKRISMDELVHVGRFGVRPEL